MLPRNSEKLYPRFLWTVAGGLLFSFLAFAALFACFLFYRRLPFAVFALTCTGLPYAFHLFFYNLLPLDNDSLFTDGAIFWGLLHRDASYRTAVNILAVEGYLNEGLAPRRSMPNYISVCRSCLRTISTLSSLRPIG